MDFHKILLVACGNVGRGQEGTWEEATAIVLAEARVTWVRVAGQRR